MMICIRLAPVVAVILMLACPAQAHHSFAMFDQASVAELTDVTVKRFVWANPHVFVIVEKDGATYTLESGSPAHMSRAGWKYTSLEPGDRVSVIYHPLRNGKPGGSLKTVILQDDTRLEAE